MTKTSIRAVTYTRISKDKAGGEHGVANQQKALERHAAACGWTVVRWLSDNDLSASNGLHRPGYDEALRIAEAAAAGKRWTGCPRPFGYPAGHVTPEPAEAAAIEWAAGALLGGSTVSAVMREWTSRGLRTPQGGKPFTRQSVTTILRNPRLAAQNAYHGEITGPGDWRPVLAEETWRAVRALLDDPARQPPRGVRTLLGGLGA